MLIYFAAETMKTIRELGKRGLVEMGIWPRCNQAQALEAISKLEKKYAGSHPQVSYWSLFPYYNSSDLEIYLIYQ